MSGSLGSNDSTVPAPLHHQDPHKMLSQKIACAGLSFYPTEFLERGGLRSGIKGGAQAEAELVQALRSSEELMQEILRTIADNDTADTIGEQSARNVAILAKVRP